MQYEVDTDSIKLISALSILEIINIVHIIQNDACLLIFVLFLFIQKMKYHHYVTYCKSVLLICLVCQKGKSKQVFYGFPSFPNVNIIL